MSIRKLGIGGALLVVWIAVLGALALPALAVNTHVYCEKCSFGSPGSGAGQLALVAAGFESEPRIGGSGIAVDDKTHDVYVADTGNRRVDEFEADGTFVRAFGANVGGMGVDLCGGLVSCSAGLEGSGPGQFTAPLFIAVDNSTGTSAGDVYVGDTADNLVTKFSESGVLLESWGTKGQLDGSTATAGSFGELAGIAVDGSGTLIVLDSADQLFKFAQEGTFGEEFTVERKTGRSGLAVDAKGDLFKINSSSIEEFTGSGSDIGQVTQSEHATDLAVETATGDLYADEGEHVEQYVFNGSGEVVEPGGSTCATFEHFVGCPASNVFGSEPQVPALSGGAGVAVDSGSGPLAGDVYVAEAATGKIDVFRPTTLADVSTGEASNVAETSASIAGTVNPDSIATTYRFEYGTSTAYGSASPSSPASVGSDATIHNLSANLTGLTPSTTYHYRIAATNANGTNYGHDKTFRTIGPPSIDAQSATGITQTAATIQAQVNPDAFDTHYHVEYGTSASYGSSTASTDIGSEATDQATSVELTGLQAGTTYSYRVVAENTIEGKLEIVDGPDETFTTVPVAQIASASTSAVSATSATLHAEINDLEVGSSYYFEYGTSTAYGSSTPVMGLAGANENLAVSTVLNGLTGDTTYHFRVVVSNSFGVLPGPDTVFGTSSATVPGLPDGRVYELVSPIVPGVETSVNVPAEERDAVNPQGEHGLYSYRPFAAAPDGEAVVYAGNPPPTGGDPNYTDSNGNEFLATRVPGGGWTSVDLQVPGKEVIYEAFSSDLSVGILSSSEGLTAGSPPAPYLDDYSHVTAEGPGGIYQPFYSGAPPHRGSSVEFVEFGTATFGGPTEETPEVHPGPLYVGANPGTSAAPAFSHVLFEANDTFSANAVDEGEFQNNLYDSFTGQPYLVNVLPGGQAAPNASFGSPSPVKKTLAPLVSHVISADGSRIFWTDRNTGDLYVRENDTSPAANTVLIDGSGQGRFETASSDGSRVFFIDCNRLTGDSTARPSASCMGPTAMGADLYEYDLESGVMTDLTVDRNPRDHLGADVQSVVGVNETGEAGSYVYFAAGGALAANDNAGGERAATQTCEAPSTAGPGTLCNLYVRHEGVTQFIATMVGGGIDGELTANGGSLLFASKQSLTGYNNEGVNEVFLYEAGSGQLRCVSCNPTGEPPTLTRLTGGAAVGAFGQRVADDGSRVFFDSGEPLVAQDVNRLLDVYEWERDGTGSCREAQGCIFILSGGGDPESSYLIGVGASGDDAFIISRADLVAQDQTDDDEVFDARVGGVQPSTESACSGTGCQGVPPAPPVFATPSSATFAGVGNFAPGVPAVVKSTKKTVKCKKGDTKNKKGKCVPKKKKSKRAKRAGHGGRTKS
jgi:hypothetical protein